MVEALLGSGLVGGLVGGIFAYGKLHQRVSSHREQVEESFGLLRKDISRLDDRIADLTDFLLREAHGEDFDKVLRPAQESTPSSRDR